MHCKACDSLLSDREATRKYASPAMQGEFVELCDDCLSKTNIDVTMENPLVSDHPVITASELVEFPDPDDSELADID